MIGAEGDGDRTLAEPEDENTAYGLAEFVAAEEMGRSRGFWWSPESDRLLVARTDDAAVARWWIPDPAHPEREPARVAYPAAGTPNAEVRLFLYGVDGQERTEVVWDRAGYPYLARVHWSDAGAPLLLVQARDQRSQVYLAVDTGTGATRTVHVDEDPVWLDLFDGVPVWAPDGRLVRIADEGGARVLAVGDRTLTGPQLQVRAVLDVSDGDVLVSASAGPEAAAAETGEVHVYRVDELGVERLSEGPGVHSAVRSGGVTVLASACVESSGTVVRVVRDGKQETVVTSYAEEPVLRARVAARRRGRAADSVRRPAPGGLHGGGRPASGADGPVRRAARPARRRRPQRPPHLAVVRRPGLRGGRGRRAGTPGRSPGWEKAVRDDFTLTLDDQIEALHALAADFPLDLGRVAIRGWSYGGYLAALAVLRRPDVFHAGIAGAPVTDWRLYDTHYTERYLGDPGAQPEVYAANSLVTDEGLSRPAGTHRPLMIIHGLADDNVVMAHTLRLSSALLAAGRPHEVLPLSGVTHMTPQEQVAENLLLLQVDFLRRSLGPR